MSDEIRQQVRQQFLEKIRWMDQLFCAQQNAAIQNSDEILANHYSAKHDAAMEIMDALGGFYQENKPGKTVRVRVAVAMAVGDDTWQAFGAAFQSDAAMASNARTFETDTVHFIEADVPVLQSQTIEGTLTK